MDRRKFLVGLMASTSLISLGAPLIGEDRGWCTVYWKGNHKWAIVHPGTG